MRAGGDQHALFRLLLLRKRFELGLPLLQPGDLRGCPEQAREEYKAFVESACRESGRRCLEAGNIGQAWRYFSALGEPEPVRAALEQLAPAQVSAETLKVALEHGVHPRRGFQIILERDGVGHAISLFDAGLPAGWMDRRYAAGLLARAMYKELVVGVCRAIMERRSDLPPERELVDLIISRRWLFEGSRAHAEPAHIAAVSRIGLLAEGREELLMSLSISEYGRLLGAEHRPAPRTPFENGFDDHARYARALLGQNVDETAGYFRARLPLHQSDTLDCYPAEMVFLLLWRSGRKEEALDLWQSHLGGRPPELPGKEIPSFYELCAEAGSYQRWAEMARKQDDVTAWAVAQLKAPPAVT